jgi:hypothetical protein
MSLLLVGTMSRCEHSPRSHRVAVRAGRLKPWTSIRQGIKGTFCSKLQDATSVVRLAALLLQQLQNDFTLWRVGEATNI